MRENCHRETSRRRLFWNHYVWSIGISQIQEEKNKSNYSSLLIFCQVVFGICWDSGTIFWDDTSGPRDTFQQKQTKSESRVDRRQFHMHACFGWENSLTERTAYWMELSYFIKCLMSKVIEVSPIASNIPDATLETEWKRKWCHRSMKEKGRCYYSLHVSAGNASGWTFSLHEQTGGVGCGQQSFNKPFPEKQGSCYKHLSFCSIGSTLQSILYGQTFEKIPKLNTAHFLATDENRFMRPSNALVTPYLPGLHHRHKFFLRQSFVTSDLC